MLTYLLTEIIFLLLFVTVLAVILYKHIHRYWLVISILIVGLIYVSVSNLPFLFHFILLLVLLVPLTVLGLPQLRKEFISKRVREYIQRTLPPISDTEREAIEAGTIGWEGKDGLFSGCPRWQQLFNIEPPKLSEEEQTFLDTTTNELCEMISDWDISKDYDLSPEVWDTMRSKGFLGMVIPRAYGGLGFSAYAHARVVQKIASRSITAGVTVMVPNSLGPGMLILEYGTDEQKKHYLPRLAKGEEIPCFALTSAQSGSDAASMPDNGVVCRGEFEGKEIIGVRLNWSKRYITLAPVATLIGLAFKLRDPEGLIGTQEDIGITLALIPATMLGVEIGKRHLPLNTPFMNGPIQGKDVFIPLDYLIGGRQCAGKGWRMLMECLSEGRAISLPSLSVAAAKYCCFATGAYARVRKQFHLPISSFEGVAKPLADIVTNTYLMTATSNFIAAAIDGGQKPSVASAIAKLHLTERMRYVVNQAMDIHGGAGICLGENNQLARMYQAIPIAITVEGANILTRSMIIFGQGVIRCHPWLYREIQAATDTEKYTLDDFDKLFVQHVYSIARNKAGTWLLAISNGWLAKNMPMQWPLRKHCRKLSRLATAFTLVVDYALLSLGGTFKRKEYISGLLGDMLSELYLASASLKHFMDQGCPSEQQFIIDSVVADCEHRFHQAMLDVLESFARQVSAFIVCACLFILTANRAACLKQRR